MGNAWACHHHRDGAYRILHRSEPSENVHHVGTREKMRKNGKLIPVVEKKSEKNLNCESLPTFRCNSFKLQFHLTLYSLFYTLAFANGRHVRKPQKAVLAHGTASIMQKWNGSKQRDFSRINFGGRACWLPWVGHYHAWNCREEKTEPNGRWKICWTWKLHEAERKLRLTTMEEARWASTKAFFLLFHRSFFLIGLFWVSWSPSSSSSSVVLRLESQMFITFFLPKP